MIAEHLECDTLLCHRDNCFLIHVRVVNSHSAEDCERFDKVLIVLGECLREINKSLGK